MDGRKKIIAVALAVVLAAAAALAYRAHEQAAEQAAARTLTLSGNVDVREVTLAFRESDRIKELLVEEGDTVHAGDVLGRLDTEELAINLRKTEAQIAGQESTVEKLRNGTRSEEIAQARQELRAARAAAENASGVYARRQQVYDDVAGVSEQELENARTDAEAKAASAEAAREKLAEAENGARRGHPRGGVLARSAQGGARAPRLPARPVGAQGARGRRDPLAPPRARRHGGAVGARLQALAARQEMGARLRKGDGPAAPLRGTGGRGARRWP